VVKCFDRIDHELLLNQLREQFGQENEGFVALVNCFLKTYILDRDQVKDVRALDRILLFID
jgi:hypothetical protein